MSGTFETRIQDYPMSRLMRTEKNCNAALAEAETVTMDIEVMKFFTKRLLLVRAEIAKR